jgi:hypothetical protein
MARRPTNFKYTNSIEQLAMKGIPENRHIGPDEKTSKITLGHQNLSLDGMGKC